MALRAQRTVVTVLTGFVEGLVPTIVGMSPSLECCAAVTPCPVILRPQYQ